MTPSPPLSAFHYVPLTFFFPCLEADLARGIWAPASSQLHKKTGEGDALHWLCFFPAQASHYGNQQDTAWSFLTETSKKPNSHPGTILLLFSLEFSHFVQGAEIPGAVHRLDPTHPSPPKPPIKGRPDFSEKGICIRAGPHPRGEQLAHVTGPMWRGLSIFARCGDNRGGARLSGHTLAIRGAAERTLRCRTRRLTPLRSCSPPTMKLLVLLVCRKYRLEASGG